MSLTTYQMVEQKSTYNLSFDGTAVDGEVAKICEQLLCTILALYKLEQIRRIIDELHALSDVILTRMRERAYSSPRLSTDKDIMSEKAE